MRVTYLGTTVLLFDDGCDQILFDAYITRPPFLNAFFGKLKTDSDIVDSIIERFQINRLKAIFISHTHIDHVLDMPYIARRTNCDIYGSKSAVNVALGGGVDILKCHEYNFQDTYKIGNFEITILKSIHSRAHIYNNDLEKTIDKPLIQPARKRDYKEGGSYDFLIRNNGKSYLIRPSYNYILGQLDGINADVLYLGIAGISRDKEKEVSTFFSETIDKVKPKIVIPIHWDNFFKPLDNEESYKAKWPLEKPENSAIIVAKYCEDNNIDFQIQMPMTHFLF